MKKLIWSLSLLAMLCVPEFMSAHPATDLKLDYDAKEKVLKVTVVHGSWDPAKHFIDTVKVSVDGVELIKQTFQSQPDGKEQPALYLIIDIKDGSKVKVDTHCCKGGDLSKEMVVKTEKK